VVCISPELGSRNLITDVVVDWPKVDASVQDFNWSWNSLLLVLGITAAITIAGILFLSRIARGRARVFLTKTFFRYKYDYRKEWLRFIGILSQAGLENVPRTAVRAVAPIVKSPGGIVWIQENDGDDYTPAGAWQCERPVGKSIPHGSSLIEFLRDKQWVIDLNEWKLYPQRYGNLELETWFAERSDFWLVVPLFIGNTLLGCITLLKPKTMPRLNFEDHDLLKTVGRHVATHIKQAESDKRLAESSQFGTYHRLSAFLMHDMNNLIAQQSLVVENAEKFRHDPKFVDDTIETISHSVSRMRRLMKQLSQNTRTPKSEKVRVLDAINKAVKRVRPREPVPQVKIECGDPYVNADLERLTVMIEHLIRNAQDATEADGKISVSAKEEGDCAVITISDTGCGMTAEFVGERLFRPFDSTKSSESMGIGAYQAREYTRMLGGQVEVDSDPGSGTEFSIRLPRL
jgi:putative PEP-CTERM system histidine kinase